MIAKEITASETIGGEITLKVCLKNAVFIAEFSKAQIKDELSRFGGYSLEAALSKYGVKLNQTEFDFRRTIYENVIKVLHDRIVQLDTDQAAYTRGMNSGMPRMEG